MLDELLDADEILEETENDSGPTRQAPALTWSEERRLRAGLAWRRDLEWLMAPEADPLPTTLPEILNRPEWQSDALCSGAGPERFYPGLGGSYAAARELCESCLVRSECLRFALANEELVGMWGGTTDRERRELRRQRRSVA